MKIVQTFWPCLENDLNASPLTIKGGWLHEQFHWMSWALSCNLLRQHYDHVELVTNNLGKELLVDRLNLPYTAVSTALENPIMNTMPSSLWTMAKVFSYGLQEEPFLHIDGDIFLFKAFDEAKTLFPLVTQNFEINIQSYSNTVENIKNGLRAVPDWVIKPALPITVCNTGVTGGTNTGLFRDYASIAFDFIKQNKDVLHNVLHDRYFGVFVEQYFLYHLATSRNISFECLFDPIKSNSDFAMLIDLYNVPVNNTFIHPIGFYKRSAYICEFVQRKLMRYFPNVFSHVKSVLDQDQISKFRMPASEEEPYHRTNFILQKFVSEDELLRSDDAPKAIQTRFAKAKSKVESEELKTLVQDCFNVEKTRSMYQPMGGDEKYEAKTEIAEVLLKRSDDALLETTFIIVADNLLIDVKYDVAHESNKAFEKKFVEAVNTDPNHQLVVLTPYAGMEPVEEHLIDVVLYPAFSTFKKPTKAAEVFKKYEALFTIQTQFKTTKEFFVQALRYWIYKGFICESVPSRSVFSFDFFKTKKPQRLAR